VTADWASVWREPREDEMDPLRHLGRPGLWKGVTTAHLPRCVFEMPLYVVDEIGAASDPDGDARFYRPGEADRGRAGDQPPRRPGRRMDRAQR
jgi:hypothetical protein